MAHAAMTNAPVLGIKPEMTGSCRGACVDVFAPGVSILSAISSSDTSTGYKTGTSMAAPFATGVIATYLEKHPVSRWHFCISYV